MIDEYTGEYKPMTEKASHILFLTGNEIYALPISVVREIIVLHEITRIPGAKPFIRGLINLRGRIMMVLDLAILLDIGETPLHEKSVAIVIGTDYGTKNDEIAVMVDDVKDVVYLEEKNFMHTSDTVRDEITATFISAVAKYGNDIVFLLDTGRLLHQQEDRHDR